MPPANTPNEPPIVQTNDSAQSPGERIRHDAAALMRLAEFNTAVHNERLRLIHSLNVPPPMMSTSQLPLPAYIQPYLRRSPSGSVTVSEERLQVPRTSHGHYTPQVPPLLPPEWQGIRYGPEYDYTEPARPRSMTNQTSESRPSMMGGYNVERLQSIIRGEFLPRAPSPPVALSSRQTNTSTSSSRSASAVTRDQWRRNQSARNATTSNRDARWSWQEHNETDHISNHSANSEMHFLRSNPRSAHFRPVEEAIKYLTKLQQKPLELSVNSSPFVGKGFPIDDFLVDASIIEISPTSFLSNGAVFDGSQYAAAVSLVHPLMPPSHPTRQTVSSTGSASRRSRNTTEGNPRNDDRWSVKVTIHGIDYDTMKLSGEMYAMEVPDWQSATGTSSINTFWEGEIIDFQRHGLETVNFTSTPQIDGTYWRKLEPFAGLNDLELAQCLVSKSFLKNLCDKWILMRWKEKCFVPPSSHESGLTISGFYFLCLKRSDGSIEGFYNDPHSSPYQQLSLKPVNRTFSSYDFR